MRTVYRGIDIAGDQGATGLVDLLDDGLGRLRVRVPPDPLCREAGLDTLVRPGDGESLAAAAIDQPLGFPAGTLRLLACPDTVHGVPPYHPKRAKFREADLAMQKALGRSDAKCVLSPTVCANIWRALHLVRRAGIDIRSARLGNATWIETHPRLCVHGLILHANAPAEYVRAYKKNKVTVRAAFAASRAFLELGRASGGLDASGPLDEAGFRALLAEGNRLTSLTTEAGMLAASATDQAAKAAAQACHTALHGVRQVLAARRHCLTLLAAAMPLDWDADVERRLLDLDQCDTFEALFCATAAFAHAHGKTRRYPEASIQSHEDFALEGAVFIPDFASLGR